MRINTSLSFVILFQLITISTYSQWQQTSVDTGMVSSMAAYGNYLFASFKQSGGQNGICYSTDGGTSWVYTNQHKDIISSTGATIYATGNSNNKVLRTTNNGISWLESGLVNSDGWMSLMSDGVNIYASKYSMQRSTDNGVSWDVLPQIGSSNLKCVAASGDLLLAVGGVDASYLYRSTNFGINWSHPSFPAHTVNSGAISGNFVYLTTQGTGLYISTNKGETWEGSPLVVPYSNKIITYEKYVFLTALNGVYISMNNGANWNSISEGLPLQQSQPKQIIVHNGYIYIGMDNFGLWKRPLTEVIGIQSISGEVPFKYILSQNYPNPFNPTTKIKFSLPKNGFTSLKIYDASGRFVDELAGMNMNTGTYEAEFNASHLASGIYFYTLAVNDFTQTNKMVLVK